MPFTRPTLGALTRETQLAIAAQLPGADAMLRRSNLGVLARVFAGLVHGIYGYLDWIARQVIPDTAEAEYLERWARLYAIERKAAQAAAGTVTLSGIDATVIASGTRLARADGALYETQAGVTIASGTASVAVRAVSGGAEGNADAGTALRFVVAIAGVNNAAAVAAGGLSGGEAVETDAGLRARLLARIQQPPQGGAAHDYVQWALAVPGVTRAWVYPSGRGPGTVDIAFVMDGRESIIPLSGDVADVQAYVEARRPVCDDVLVFAPTAAPLAVTISGLSADTPAIRAAVTAELAAQIRRDAAPGGTTRRSRLIEAVSRATGEEYHSMIVPSADVAASAGTIHVLGTVTFA